MKTLLLLLLIAPQANASWLGRTCSRIFSAIAVDDPYQYEQVLTSALITYYEELGIKGAWNKLEPDEAIRMNIIGAELRWRIGPVMIQFELEENIARIENAMDLYREFEGKAVQTKDRR